MTCHSVSFARFLRLYHNVWMHIFPLMQQIMKDRWMNVGHEEEELKPYTEPEADFNDTKRIGTYTCRHTHMAYTWCCGIITQANYCRLWECFLHVRYFGMSSERFYVNLQHFWAVLAGIFPLHCPERHPAKGKVHYGYSVPYRVVI